MNVFDNIVGAEHIVAESSLLLATYGGRHIKDIKMDKDRDNGTCVGLSAIAAGYADAQVFTAKAAVAGEPVFLLLQPPFNYNNDRKAMSDEKYFYNARNEVARGYKIGAGDVFTVSAMAITPLATAPVVGHYVSFDEATGKYIEAESAPASGICIAQVMEVVHYKNSVSYRLLVVAPSKVA